MQNTNTILTKNSALSNMMSNANGNKSEVNAVSAVESPSSFQQMFSKQLQQEQANNSANQKQINQAQTNQNLATQQANMKAQEANQARVRATQKNAQQADNQVSTNKASTQPATNAAQQAGEKAEGVASASQTQSSNAEAKSAGETNKSIEQKTQAKDKETDDAQQTEATSGKKITIADLVADLKLAKPTNKKDEPSEDEAQAKTTQDVSPQDLLQAASLAAAQLAAQKPITEVAKPVETTVASKIGANVAGVDNIATEKTQKSAQPNQADVALSQTDGELGQAQAQANTKSLDDKVDATKQTWFEGAMGKAMQASADKQTGSFAENLADKTLQANSQLANAQLNAQSKLTEQIITPAAMSSVSAYQSTANSLGASSAANGASNYIAASPGKSGWDQAISQKVVWMVGSGEQSATLNLNPPDLGPLQVVINVNNDKADTTFISQNVEVRKALEEGMSTLRDMMGQAGVELGQTNVSTNSQAQQSFEEASKQANRPAGISESNQSPEPLLNGVAVARASNGLVDTFA